MTKSQVKSGKYKHFKGDIVEVTGMALHSESLEEFVLYKHATGKRKNEKHFWIRPVKMFLEKVEVNDKKVSRFKYLGKN